MQNTSQLAFQFIVTFLGRHLTEEAFKCLGPFGQLTMKGAPEARVHIPRGGARRDFFVTEVGNVVG